MDPEQAARAADRIGAKLAIPIHYNRIVGSTSEAKQFRELTKVPVAILPEE
jgi:L-ascorbate metabolism protein UlaG (beta-lactamase superfamily)